MRVHDVMSTGIVTALKSDTVRSVVVKMMNRNCGAIPVVEGDSRLIGMVTLRDVLLPLYPNYGDYIHDNVHSRDFVEMEAGYPEVLGKKVEEIMTSNPLTVAPGDPDPRSRFLHGPEELSPHSRCRQAEARWHAQHRRHQPGTLLRVGHERLEMAIRRDVRLTQELYSHVVHCPRAYMMVS